MTEPVLGGEYLKMRDRLKYRWVASQDVFGFWKWTLYGDDTDGTSYIMGHGSNYTMWGAKLAIWRKKRAHTRPRKPAARRSGTL